MSITRVAGWLLQQNLEPVNFKSGEMKSAVVCAGGTESCVEQRFRGQRGRLPWSRQADHHQIRY